MSVDTIEKKDPFEGRIRPGTILDRGLPSEHKMPYSRRDIEEIYGMVEYEPPVGGQVTINGHTWYLEAEAVNIVPRIVRDEFRRQREADKASGRRVLRDGGVTQLGPLEPRH